MTRDLTDIFGPVISTYSRRQAIEDGVLVQLSGPGYPDDGDEWLPKMCKEAGFRVPVAMTIGAFYAAFMPPDGHKLAPGQDPEGRLWDVLWMLRLAIRRNGPGSRLEFSLRVVPTIPEDSNRNPKARVVRLACVCGPDDDASPCLTIMLPEED